MANRGRFEARLDALENQYRQLLLTALRECAAGRWGLFGHNDAAIKDLAQAARKRLQNPAAVELLKLGSQIEQDRRKLGYPDAFALHERFVRLRSSRSADTLGEPKLARQWLDEFI